MVTDDVVDWSPLSFNGRPFVKGRLVGLGFQKKREWL